MWPLWAYMLTGVVAAWLTGLLLVILAWLHEEHPEVTGGLLIALAITIFGALIGAAVHKAKTQTQTQTHVENPANR